MAYVTIPKDLSRIQSKVLFGLTKRQVICFGAAALVGVPLFFLAKASLGTTTAALCMILVMLPFFLFAMYEKNGVRHVREERTAAGSVPGPSHPEQIYPAEGPHLPDQQSLFRPGAAI